MKARQYLVSPGQRFGFWEAVERAPVYIGSPKALCRCICGRLRDVQISHLLDGTSRSCGCARRIKTVEEYFEKKFRVKPKIQVKAPSTEKLYKMWLNLKRGHDGAPLCAEWQTYHNFKTWALKTGYTEGKHTLVRIDPNKGYEPDNCQWQ